MFHSLLIAVFLLDGPQLTPSSSVAIFWGVAFLGYRPTIVRLELGSSFSSPSAAQ